MSCHVIEYVQGRKVMRPVGTAQEYRSLRAGTRALICAAPTE